MADLTYQDMQRAVQDGIRSMQSDMQRLTNDVAGLSQRTPQRFDDMQRDIQQLQGELSRHDPRSEQTMQQISRDLQELKTRFEVVERFCREMSEYFRARNDEEREDKGYRSV
jgi:ParB-like chromosome segregation protein Spo0J